MSADVERDINEVATEMTEQFDRGTHLVVDWMRLMGMELGLPSDNPHIAQILGFGFVQDVKWYDLQKRARLLLSHAFDGVAWARDDLKDEALTAAFVDIALRAHGFTRELAGRDAECAALANELRNMHKEFGQ